MRKRDLSCSVIQSSLNGTLQRLPKPALLEQRLLMTGMFRYLADAPSIS